MNSQQQFYEWFNQSNNELDAAWEQKKNTDYKYDRYYDYYKECEQYENNLYKKGQYSQNGRLDNDTYLAFQLMLKQIYFGINENAAGENFKPMPDFAETHFKRHYKNWLYFKYTEFKKDYLLSRKTNTGLPYYWITLNFNKDAPVDMVMYHVKRFVTFNILRNCIISYCIEYFTDTGGHPHAHILIEMNRTGLLKPSQLKQLFFQDKSIKKYMSNETGFDYKYSRGKDEKRARPREELKLYLNGCKKEKKEENCEKDKEWRLEHNIENIYVYHNK